MLKWNRMRSGEENNREGSRSLPLPAAAGKEGVAGKGRGAGRELRAGDGQSFCS
jgi:hypothetical protein